MHVTPRSLLTHLSGSGRLRARNRIVFSTVDSTNEVGKRIAADCLRKNDRPTSCVVVALQQTAGRGRLGRRWRSPSGGVYASYVWFCSSQQLQLLPLRVGIALRASLHALTGLDCKLKWPNDLMVDGRKLGGILIEAISIDGAVAAVIGFGINFAGAELDDSRAASVAELTVSPPTYTETVLGLLVGVEQELAASRAAGEVVREYAAWTHHALGDPIRCRTADGVSEGEFLGFDNSGLLRLATATGETLLAAGDILESGADHRYGR